MGEVRVREDEIDDFIEAAESLRIDGINSSSNDMTVSFHQIKKKELTFLSHPSIIQNHYRTSKLGMGNDREDLLVQSW
jgi:hypothetical protein